MIVSPSRSQSGKKRLHKAGGINSRSRDCFHVRAYAKLASDSFVPPPPNVHSPEYSSSNLLAAVKKAVPRRPSATKDNTCCHCQTSGDLQILPQSPGFA